MRIRAVCVAILVGLTLATCGPTPVFAQEGVGPASECFDAVPDTVDDTVEPLDEARPRDREAERDSGDRDRADADGDGVPDRFDLCPDAPQPAQEDSDGDGVGDACECVRELWPGLVVEPMGPSFINGRREVSGPAPEATAMGCDAPLAGDGHGGSACVVLLALVGVRRRRRPTPDGEKTSIW
jgi:uncharacterized protein (TIGR03382 family)